MLDTRGGGLPAVGARRPLLPGARPGVGSPDGIPLPGVGRLDLGIPPDVGIALGVCGTSRTPLLSPVEVPSNTDS